MSPREAAKAALDCMEDAGVCVKASEALRKALVEADDGLEAENERLRAELARALRDRDNALELAAQACVDEVNRNMDEYTRLPENVTRRVIYAAMGVSAANCRDSIREIIDAGARPNPPNGTESAP